MELTESSDQKILITGASGGIGKQLIYQMTARGIKPIAHCRETSDTTYIDSHKLEKRFADMRDREALKGLVAGVDAVIHSAAIVNFRQDRLTEFTGINTIGSADLYKAARGAGVKRFVHVSSVVGVGARQRKGGNSRSIAAKVVNEQLEYNLGHLRIPYCLTKRAAEEELMKLYREEGGPELVVVNPSIVVSPSRSGNDRAKALKHYSHWFLPDYPNIVNLVDVRDLAPGIISALEKGRAGERYILAGSNYTARDLLIHISANLGKVPHLVHPPRPLVDIAARWSVIWSKLIGKGKVSFYPDLVKLIDYDWAYSSAKARTELGYKTRSVLDTLDDLVSNDFTGSWLKPAR